MRVAARLGLLTVTATIGFCAWGSVSALATGSTALCVANESPCSAANLIVNSHIQFEALDTRLLTSIGTYLCETSILLGEVLGLAQPLLLDVDSFALSGCKLGATNCTDISTTVTSPAKILKTAANLGSVEFTLLGFRLLC